MPKFLYGRTASASISNLPGRYIAAVVSVCLLWACHSIEATPNQPFTAGPIMPNPAGFIKDNISTSGIQGAFYWFDDGMKSTVRRVDVYMSHGDDHAAGDGKAPPPDYCWQDSQNLENQRFGDAEDIPIHDLCIEGTAAEMLALGFELCSTQGHQNPLEFPAPLGRCEVPETETLLQRFRGVEFDIELDTPGFFEIVVEFKEWGDPNIPQPRCTVYSYEPNMPDTDVPCAYKYLDDSKRHIRITAEAASAQTEQSTPINLSMLQAIHIMVYKRQPPAQSIEEADSDQINFRYCLSRLYALYSDKDDLDSMNLGQVKSFDTACGEPSDEKYEPVSISTDTDAAADAAVDTDLIRNIEWFDVPAQNDGGVSDKSIMRTEVTVGQYRQCVEDGPCPNITPNWESCNASASGRIDTPDWQQRAVNCVDWCQAQTFCNWLNGDLPDLADWKAAADTVPREEDDLSCDNTVMQDAELGYGVGCGERMPAEACSRQAQTTKPPLCDMFGNLWEWVRAADTPWKPPVWAANYQSLVGGSLNTVSDYVFKDYQITIEHPTIPHSPTRLGFRCIKKAN